MQYEIHERITIHTREVEELHYLSVHPMLNALRVTVYDVPFSWHHYRFILALYAFISFWNLYEQNMASVSNDMECTILPSLPYINMYRFWLSTQQRDISGSLILGN
jgi:hypothetical protein